MLGLHYGVKAGDEAMNSNLKLHLKVESELGFELESWSERRLENSAVLTRATQQHGFQPGIIEAINLEERRGEEEKGCTITT